VPGGWYIQRPPGHRAGNALRDEVKKLGNLFAGTGSPAALEKTCAHRALPADIIDKRWDGIRDERGRWTAGRSAADQPMQQVKNTARSNARRGSRSPPTSRSNPRDASAGDRCRRVGIERTSMSRPSSPFWLQGRGLGALSKCRSRIVL
jgi:hypothetical protein